MENRISDTKQYQQMDRVEEIEKIFHPLSFFVIVHIQGNESQTGQRLPKEAETACNGLFQRILIKGIEDDDQHDPSPVIVCLRKSPQLQEEEAGEGG